MRKLLSEYYSNNGKRDAKVYTDGNEFIVICVNELGSHFKSVWDTEQKAEDYAEDWVTTHV